MSYLAGPMTREQIRQLRASETAATTPTASAPAPLAVAAPVAAAALAAASGDTDVARPPILPPDITQVWLPSRDAAAAWHPAVLGVADVTYTQARLGVAEQRRQAWLAPLDEDMLALDWSTADEVASWSRALQKYVSTNAGVTLFQSKALKLVSHVGESEGAFRARLQMAAREAGDARLETMRKKYATRLQTAQEKVRRTQAAIEAQEAKASQAKLDSALSIGSAVLGALFGKKKLSATTLGKAGTAARSMGRAQSQSSNVARATDTFEAAQQELAELEARIAEELQLEAAAYDALAEQLDEVTVKPKSSDVHVQFVALAWVPSDNTPRPPA
jgi:hypothetical protein